MAEKNSLYNIEMPYHVVQFPDGYRVVSENGHVLSHKPLTYEKAQAQATAVRIHEFGGAKKDWYYEEAKKKARAYGINNIEYADDGVHKFQIVDPNGKIVRFGLHGYNDFLLYKHQEKEGLIPKGTANQHRKNYRNRAMLIKGKWRENPYSPNNLAINILW